MSEESIRTEGASPARAGKSARQLIRRAKQVSRRKFPAEEKIRILLGGIRAEASVVSNVLKTHNYMKQRIITLTFGSVRVYTMANQFYNPRVGAYAER